MPYILEVQKYYPFGYIDHPEWYGKSEHIGYMNKLFMTRQEACDYYKLYNPHMRAINKTNKWHSDWDPVNMLIYVVRERLYEYMKIKPFEEQ